MRRFSRFGLAIAVAAMSSVLAAATGCAAGGDAPDPPAPASTFPAIAAFDYQLGAPYPPAPGVQLVVRDRTAPPADDAYSVCYVNAFQTQPGDESTWPEELLLTVDGGRVTDPEWPDEYLLDASTDDKREAIAGVISAWIEGCAADGFRAVEFDNLDSFTRSRGALSLDDNIALAARLAATAHESGLAVGQKNAAEHALRLREEAGFDFAVAEECAAYDECSAYTEVYADAVIDIEYADNLPRRFEEMCRDADSPRAMILRDRELVIPGADGYVSESCRE